MGSAAAAQDQAPAGLRFDPPPSPVACLTVLGDAAQRPGFPTKTRNSLASATVRVTLRFTAADRAPDADVAYASSDDKAFEEVARAHVARYRLPCLQPGNEPIVASQVFDFSVGDVHTGTLRDVESEFSRMSGECRDKAMPVVTRGYSAQTANMGLQGNVRLRMTFVAPDAPPKIDVLYDGGHHRLADYARRVAENYRLPCKDASLPPAVARQTWGFKLEAESRFQLKQDIALIELLRLVKDIEKERVRFDLTTMGCPFQVAFAPFRPYDLNEIGEIGPADRNRRDFLDWLASLALDIQPVAARPHIIGQQVRVTVPCGVVELP